MFFLFMDPKDFKVFPGVERFEKALDAVCAVDPHMSVATLNTLVHVARRLPALSTGTLTLHDIAAEMNVGYSSLLRQTDILGEGAPAVRSLNLLEKGVRPDDRRSRQVRLTSRGERLLQEISGCMTAPLSEPKIAGPGEETALTDQAASAALAARSKIKNRPKKQKR